MYCTNCSNNKPLKTKKLTEYRYTECGLDNVLLNGVIQSTCPTCGETYRSFGNIDQLNASITDLLLTKKEFLTGKEVRFLRSSIGYSGRYFSQVLGVEPETISRIENGKNKVTRTLDRHIRSAVFNKTPHREYDLHDKMTAHPVEVKGNIKFTVSKNIWKQTSPVTNP